MINDFILKITGKNAKIRKQQKDLMVKQAKSVGFNGQPYRNNTITRTYQRHLNKLTKSANYQHGPAIVNGQLTKTYLNRSKGRKGLKYVKMTDACRVLKHHKSLFKTNGAINRPLSVTFYSGVLNVKKRLSFTDRRHLIYFLERMESDNVMTSSYSRFKTFQDVAARSGRSSQNLNNVWDVFAVKIDFLHGGKDKNTASYPKIKLNNHNLVTYSPASKNNNCALRCIEYLALQEGVKIKLDGRKVRNDMHLDKGCLIGAEMVCEIYKTHVPGNKKLNIVDMTCEETFDLEQECYMMIHDEHYTVITEAKEVSYKNKKTMRGLLTWDLETRQVEDYVFIEASKTRSHILTDSICSIHYRPYKSTECYTKTFKTDDKMRCVDKFKQFLCDESKEGRTYTCIAHNSSRFDHYLFVDNFNEKDLMESEMQLRGTSIIGLQYRSHIFKDSCCFMPQSLSDLCKGFLRGDDVEFCKIEEIELDGRMMTNKELCFYKPDLNITQFLQLEQDEPAFWSEYVKYCEYDCISLFLVWDKFSSQMHNIIGKIGKHCLRKCSLLSTNTIGSLTKKILEASVGLEKKGESKYLNGYYKNYAKFMGEDQKKYEFLKNFKRGGISHCHQPSRHNGTASVDITSQYPASLQHARIPCGKSIWVNEYKEHMHGFYELKNLKFDRKSLKPCASVNNDTGVLNWVNENIESVYLDSYMIKYLKKKHGLISFDVENGLLGYYDCVGKNIFSKYVMTLFQEKSKQDELKDAGLDYNPAYREVIKLCLNSVTGKLVEDPSKHFKLSFDPDDKQDLNVKMINGVKCYREPSENINPWLICGLMVYSYSKRLLFEYIDCLPNRSDDVTHLETDGLYFSRAHRKQFEENLKNYDGDYPEVGYGDWLGSIKLEKDIDTYTYFLGKKFYYMCDGREGTKIKGVPLKTIDKHGRDVTIVDKTTYERVYAGEKVPVRFATLMKSLYTNKKNKNTQISSHYMTRTIRPMMDYHEYVDGKAV